MSLRDLTVRVCLEFERFYFRNNKTARQYEETQMTMNSVLVGLFYSKCLGGTKIDQSLFEFYEEQDMVASPEKVTELVI